MHACTIEPPGLSESLMSCTECSLCIQPYMFGATWRITSSLRRRRDCPRAGMLGPCISTICSGSGSGSGTGVICLTFLVRTCEAPEGPVVEKALLLAQESWHECTQKTRTPGTPPGSSRLVTPTPKLETTDSEYERCTGISPGGLQLPWCPFP